MVTINRIILAGALAAIANAIPIAEARPIAFANAQPITNDPPKGHADSYPNKTILLARDTPEGNNITKRDIPESYNITKRAVSENFNVTKRAVSENFNVTKREIPEGYNITKRADIAVVPDLSTLLGQSTTLIGESLETILGLDVSSGGDQITTLLTNINSYLGQVETAIKNYVPATGVGSELQNLIVKTGLQSLVFVLSSLVGTLATLLSQGSSQPQILAQVKELYSHIEAISNAGGKFSLLGTLGDIVHSILSVIANILESI
ncbi:hypothetical protein D0Z00_002380 [Geotrichum galactomycetum]|uniref:Uncharacterized protein n=1 Tax=Geotrichum galactomycetum TaxID=27317 RepID=A0ACB6V4B8_9ASCO|nr:hypothetical protein D0Z00_002380 [Geotrichum candidum]